MFSKRMLLTIGGVFFLLCCLIWIGLSSRHPESTEDASGVPVSIIAPFQNVFTTSLRSVKGVWHHYFALVSTARENDQLRRALHEAVAESRRCEEVALTNKRLETFLTFKKQTAPHAVAAQVIGQDPSRWFKTIVVDKGASDGVAKGMPVVVPEGVVGQVVMTTAQYSKVLLMIDRNSAVDALVQRTRARGLIKGKTGGRCSLQYALRKHDIAVGDAVISSGLDRVYPKGLLIGYVTSVVRRNAGIFQEVDVTPAVEFEKLEEVLVVLKKDDCDIPL